MKRCAFTVVAAWRTLSRLMPGLPRRGCCAPPRPPGGPPGGAPRGGLGRGGGGLLGGKPGGGPKHFRHAREKGKRPPPPERPPEIAPPAVPRDKGQRHTAHRL